MNNHIDNCSNYHQMHNLEYSKRSIIQNNFFGLGIAYLGVDIRHIHFFLAFFLLISIKMCSLSRI